MNFKLHQFITLTVNFLIGSFFFLFGVFSIILSWSHNLQNAMIQFISENRWIFSLFGCGCVVTGISIVIYTFLKTKHRYVQIRTGNFSVALDENIIHQYLEPYWHKHFPLAKIPYTLNLRKHSLEIIADFPPLPLIEQKAFLEQIKQDFSDLFGRVLGYPGDVHLIANFRPPDPVDVAKN